MLLGMSRTNYDLGSEIEKMLADFCAANDDTPKVRVLRRAVKFYIENRRTDDVELAKRMDEARKAKVAALTARVAELEAKLDGWKPKF